MARIRIPHNFELDPIKDAYVIDYMGSQKRFAALVWHRRAKKTRAMLNKQIQKILKRTQPGVCYHVLPTYRQAKQVVWDVIIDQHVPREIISRKNESELAIYYKNGVIQRFIGAEDPDKHRGTNPFDVNFDEWPEMKEEVWTAIFQPVLMENGGTATFGYTPKGKNHGFKTFVTGRENPIWFTSIKPVTETQVFTKEDLDEIKRNTPQALFGQEYLCDFVEGAGQFFRRIRQNTYPMDKLLPPEGDFQLGVDLAKYQDWTVITPFNLNFFVAYPQERFNQVDWNLQKARIEAAARRHHTIDSQETALIWPDSTGIGDPIVEDLQNRGLRIGGEDGRGFKFTETSKQQLLDNLAILLEQDKIKIPDDEGLITELESFQYSLSDRGKIKVGVPDGMTDDRVMSLALSVWGVREKVKPDISFITRVQHNRESSRSFK